MEPIKTLIVDDEKPARDRLIHLLAHDERVVVAGEASNGVDAIDFIESRRPDLVLLDIQMPGMDGFEVVRMVKGLPMVVFTTAYDEYAIKAFEIHALDYLLKPIPAARLEQAIERAWQELGKGNRGEPDPLLQERMLQALNEIAPPKLATRIPVRLGERVQLVNVNDIFWFQVRDKLVSLVTGSGEMDTHFTTINQLENSLDPEIFFRVHRSVMVNLNHIKEIQPWFHGALKLVMDDGKNTELDVSREHARRLRRQLGW